MTSYRFGDVVLVDFLQSFSNRKKRPALVILDIGDADIVLAPITSREKNGDGNCELKGWAESGLLLESWARLAKVACLEKSDIIRRLGRLADRDKKKVSSTWKKLYGF